jgi:putative chitinase
VITLDQLKKIIPYAGPRAGFFLAPLNDAMDEFGIDTPARQAAFLSQVAVESGSLRYVSEIASGAAYNGRKDLGNTKPEALRIAALYGSTPGPFWKGHGLIQITGYDNHLACGQALGLDLLNHPELLEEPINAARSAAWFWKEHGLNKWADAGDCDGVSDVINKGRKTAPIGDANGYQERLAFYQRAKEVLA